jgi:hypothetical protein
MAAAEEELSFPGMNEMELRQWVDGNPGRVNDKEGSGICR